MREAEVETEGARERTGTEMDKKVFMGVELHGWMDKQTSGI